MHKEFTSISPLVLPYFDNPCVFLFLLRAGLKMAVF